MLVQGSIPCFRVAVPVLLFFYLERERKKKTKKKVIYKEKEHFPWGEKKQKTNKTHKKKKPSLQVWTF